MNKLLTFSFVILLFSCNKEKQSNRYVSGDWEIKNYSEIIFDGTTNKFNLISGSVHFDNLNGKSEANFNIVLQAENDSDTINRSVYGVYSRRAIDTLELKLNDTIYLFDINRLFKKDMNLQGGFDANRKGVYILKKK